MSEVIDSKNERIKHILLSLERMKKNIREMSANHKPILNGEHYLTDNELATRLKVSRRTIQEWRNNGEIGYFLLGGKILYAESDIQAMLERHYYKPWK